MDVVFKPHRLLGDDFHPAQTGRQDPTEDNYLDGSESEYKAAFVVAVVYLSALCVYAHAVLTDEGLSCLAWRALPPTARSHIRTATAQSCSIARAACLLPLR